MKKLLFGLIATVMLSLVGNAQGLRAAFLKNKNQSQIVADFNKLNSEEKNALWVEKMDQLLSQGLPNEHVVLIKNLKSQIIKNKREKAFELIETAIDLTKITPEDDFIKMFESLYDYNYNGGFTGKTEVTSSIIETINQLGTVTVSEYDSILPSCNCNWTCGLYASHTSSCNATIDGCGFLGFSACDGWV